MGLLEGKVALITGASRGIGKAIALKFASEGADIAFTDIKISDDTVKELEALGVRVRAYASNAADFAQTHETVEQIMADFGRIDILVNNAGITRDGLMLRMDEAQWDAVINVNLKSAYNYIHACTPIMARQRGGSIINMSSVVGVSGNAGQCNYSASKAGLIGLAKSIAKEMGPRGIRANCIAPGFIISDMTAALPEEVREAWVKQIPLRRGGTPEDVAKVALFLASDLSSYVSGQVIHCCGAMNCSADGPAPDRTYVENFPLGPAGPRPAESVRGVRPAAAPPGAAPLPGVPVRPPGDALRHRRPQPDGRPVQRQGPGR